MRTKDLSLLAAFCLLLFGYCMLGFQPLTMHEVRLPECSREMQANHDWLIPRSGGRPWLEWPLLPMWITVGLATLLRQTCDTLWIVRLGSVLMGCGTVC